jgi:hypothetical protein
MASLINPIASGCEQGPEAAPGGVWGRRPRGAQRRVGARRAEGNASHDAQQWGCPAMTVCVPHRLLSSAAAGGEANLHRMFIRK